MSNNNQQRIYVPQMSRRDSLKWLGALAATTAVPGLVACSDAVPVKQTAGTIVGHWPELKLTPISAAGYGKDPNLIMPPATPWPRTLTPAQLDTVAVLSDWIIPMEGSNPSATQVKVPDVIDEWVSAPYDGQQRDRETILHLLAWLDDEAKLHGAKSFIALTDEKQQSILDAIATRDDNIQGAYTRPADAFSRYRALVLAGYFSSPQGRKDIGFKGNVAIGGDYPGPSEEARAHINKVIDDLGLSEYAYPDY